jgi:pSer/pThr/pTyr-binding forkhead associated (FHA) protein
MRLSVQIEFDRIIVFDTLKHSITIGRGEDCDLVILNKEISRLHCKMEQDGEKIFVTDLESSNGVFIDGKRLTPYLRVELGEDSIFSLGKLECEIGKISKETNSKNILSVLVDEKKDITQTIKLARLDINREIQNSRKLTLNPASIGGPRNPITAHEGEEEKEKSSKTSRLVLLFFIICLLAFLFRKKILL